MFWLLLSCADVDPQGPASPGSGAAASLEELRKVRQASADIEEPTVRLQALLTELRTGSRPQEEVLAEVRIELARAQEAEARMSASMDAAEAALEAP